MQNPPSDWHNAQRLGWPPFPDDGLLLMFMRLPSSMRHVPLHKPTHSNDNIAMLAFSSRRHTHLKATPGSPLEFLFGYSCTNSEVGLIGIFD